MAKKSKSVKPPQTVSELPELSLEEIDLFLSLCGPSDALEEIVGSFKKASFKQQLQSLLHLLLKALGLN